MSLIRETGQFIQYMQQKSSSPLILLESESDSNSEQICINFDPLLQQHPMFKELISIYRLHIEKGEWGGGGTVRRQFQMYHDRMRQVIPDIPEGQSPLLDQLIRLACTQQFLSR